MVSWSHGKMIDTLNICFARAQYSFLSHDKYATISVWHPMKVYMLDIVCGHMTCEYYLYGNKVVIKSP